MATIDYGCGEREFTCSGWTCVLYEQQFHSDPYERVTGDLIADVMGKLEVSSNDAVKVNDDGSFELTIDYTRENWGAVIRALWAMLRTAYEIAVDDGRTVPQVPGYKEWSKSLMRCEPDMRSVSYAVANELQRGLFRAGAAASGKTSREEQG